MEFDALWLARFQFAFTVSFHIIFPAFTIGLASYLMVLEGLWLLKKDDVYINLYKYWLRIFAVTFGMGVVSGLVMSYQFGTNWGPFADATGPVLGPLMGYEVMTAFFLESGFLGVMLFGMKRVGKGLHFLSTCLVAIGTLISAFWILAANSWMQTPAGFDVVDGRFFPADWFAIVFNPSFPFRFVHMTLAAYLTTALVVGGTGAWHLLKDKRAKPARVMFSMAMWMAALAAPLQLVAGDLHGLNTLKHQPAKIAAMEGHWDTKEGQPLYLFGWPDMAAEETRYAIAVPKLGSLILTHSFEGEVKGLKAWPADERPYAPLVFWSFRVMVGLGLLMIAMGLWSLYLRARRKLYDSPRLFSFAVLMSPMGFVAVLAGWITTEVGRQPWTVQGLMRTADSVSPVDTPAVASSLAAFAVVYFLVFGAGVYYLLRLMAKGPSMAEAGPRPGVPRHAAGITPAQAMEREGGKRK